MSQQPEDPKDYADVAPNLTADEPGSVGDRMPPISADLEWAQDAHAPGPGEEPEAGVVRVSDRVGADGPAPGANQSKAEDIPPSPSQAGPTSEGPGSAELPDVATRSSGGGAPLTAGDPGPGTTTPPDLLGGARAAPTMAAAPPGEGLDEQGTARPAIATPGKPDGEVDTRV